MKSSVMKRLFAAIRKGEDEDIDAISKQIISEERKRGHGRLARELEAIVRSKETLITKAPTQWNRDYSLSALPFSKRESAPLVQVLTHEKLRHHMVLSEAVEARFMRIEKEYAARTRLALYGLRARNRILLYGPPGCGKTLGSERLAWATGLPMHRVRFDTLVSSYFGETARNLQRVFDDAQKRPCALVLDECDTIARSRTEGNDVGEIPRIVNMLLQLLEDFGSEGMVMAATNISGSLDKAMFRRFDEVIELPKPSLREIKRLLKVSLSSMKNEIGLSLDDFAMKMEGQAFSEIVKVVQNAAKRCVLANRPVVTRDDLEAAIREQERVA
jgi:SpoVK/Ycf46/Vps4 family AAA+-type ATPase